MADNIHTLLSEIQRDLHAPKDKTNDFGGYKYRNAEGIVAAFKGLSLSAVSLICTDDVVEVAVQIFVTATASLTFAGETISAKGHAMHPLQKKGMDASQITGSASSYARKYALAGLFAIEDETQDPDSRDNRNDNGQTKPPELKVSPEEAAILEDLAKQAGTDRAALFKHLKVEGEGWSDLPEAMFIRVRNGMQDKIANAEHDKSVKKDAA